MKFILRKPAVKLVNILPDIRIGHLARRPASETVHAWTTLDIYGRVKPETESLKIAGVGQQCGEPQNTLPRKLS